MKTVCLRSQLLVLVRKHRRMARNAEMTDGSDSLCDFFDESVMGSSYKGQEYLCYVALCLLPLDLGLPTV